MPLRLLLWLPWHRPRHLLPDPMKQFMSNPMTLMAYLKIYQSFHTRFNSPIRSDGRGGCNLGAMLQYNFGKTTFASDRAFEELRGVRVPVR